jgi:hypothetical protein
MQLEQLLRPEVYGRRRGGYIDRRRIPAAEAEPIRRASSDEERRIDRASSATEHP